MLKSRGLHHTEEGLKVINLILSQNNSRRLSTFNTPKVDRALLYAKIEKLLSGPHPTLKSRKMEEFISFIKINT